MNDSMIAFIKSQKGYNWAINYAKSHKIKNLNIISLDSIESKGAKDGLVIQCENLSEYRQDSLDIQIVEKINELIDNLFDNNIELYEYIQKKGIDIPIRYAFVSKFFSWFRKSITIARIINIKTPCCVIADAYWLPYCELAEIHSTNSAEVSTANNGKKKIGLNVTLFIHGFLSILYLIIIPVTIGKIANYKKKEFLKKCSLLMIGASSQNKSFYPIWRRVQEKILFSGELLVARINKELLTARKEKNNCVYIEGLIKINSIPSILFDLKRVIGFYRRSNVEDNLVFGKSICSSFRSEINRFIFASICRSLLYAQIGQELIKHKYLKRVILTTIGDFSISLSNVLRQNKIETISTTHGMVLEPLGYRTNDSIKITWGAFDAQNLKNYSHDNNYVYINSTPLGMQNNNKKKESHALRPGNLISVFIEGKAIDPSDIKNKINGKCAVIFPSSNISGRSLKRFLTISINHLYNNKAKYGFEYIVVKIKNHRLSPVKEYLNILPKIGYKKISVPVVLSRDVDITKLLKNATFSLCSVSSIMLDLIRCNVPFAIYTFGNMSDRAFISRFPDWMRFKDEHELDLISKEDLDCYRNEVVINLKDIFWGKNGGYDLENLSTLLTH